MVSLHKVRRFFISKAAIDHPAILRFPATGDQTKNEDFFMDFAKKIPEKMLKEGYLKNIITIKSHKW